MSSASSLEHLFFECLQKDTPEERAAFLASACAGDPETLRRLQKMLEAHDSTFLEQAAFVPDSSSAAPGFAERVGQRIGAYRLVEPLGEGGMGTVWRAEQLEPVQRQVALKLIKAGMDSRQVVARFEAERQALALMDHPNIARVLDGGADEAGRPYFVMDLFAGVPITRYCDEARLPVRQRLELFVQVCEAIQHAHQKGVIHRDIKPSNVLVALQDGRAVPKVIDFGIAKAIEAKLTEATALTQQGGLVGTLEYMSPEQSARSAEGVDTRSDIYSLGVLLYELLTGSTPLSRRLLERASLPEILRVIADDETPKPSTRLRAADADTSTVAAQRGVARTRLASLISGELDWIAMKALEKDRDRRYATAADLAQDVRRFLADEPVLAGPPSATYRLRKLARRNRVALAAAFVLMAGLLVAIGGVGWAMRDRAARSADAERAAADRRTRVDSAVGELLALADRQMSAQAWSDALATARRADAAATSGEADAATARKVRVLLEDLEFVDRLDRVRSSQAVWSSTGFDSAAMVREYVQAFREHGIDVEADSAESMVERLRTTPALGLPLATGLDDLSERWLTAGRDLDGLGRFLRVACTIDPEPVRVSIRRAWIDPADSADEVLQRLVETIDVRAQHPATLAQLARVSRSKDEPATLRLRRAAQHAHPDDFWLAFDLSNALVRAKDLEGALAYSTAAVAIRPESAPAHSNLAHVLLNLRQVEQGIRSLQRALEIAPDLSVAHLNMGKAMKDLRRFDEAIVELRKGLDLDPHSALAWLGLGETFLEMNRIDEAGDAIRRALELEPENIHALADVSNIFRAQGKLDEAIAAARRAIAVDPTNAGVYISLGNALGEKGDLLPCAAAFRKAIELEPKNAVALANLGGTLSQSEDPSDQKEALVLCRKAVALDPLYVLGHSSLGNALLRSGDAVAAAACYRRAIELDPNFAGAHSNLGMVCIQLQRFDEALAAHRRALELRPGDAGALYGIALALGGKKEWAEAEAPMRAALAASPGNANMHHTLAVFLKSLERFDESLAAYRRAAELEPRVAFRHLAVGVTCTEQERWDEAAVAVRKAIEFEPENDGAWVFLHRITKAQGRLCEALDAQEHIFRKFSEDPSAVVELALLLATCPDAARRDAARAVELAKHAVEMQPGEAEAYRALAVAHHRAGHPQEALDALAGAVAGDLGFGWFVAAMSHERLGDTAAARKDYDEGVEWLARTSPSGEDAYGLRREAAALLGIGDR